MVWVSLDLVLSRTVDALWMNWLTDAKRPRRCKDEQTSADAVEGGEATGAMSHAFVAALTQNPNQTYL